MCQTRLLSHSWTVFGIYFDELGSFVRDHIQEGDDYLHVFISPFLFVVDMILLASLLEWL
jgi:hypothetical protein